MGTGVAASASGMLSVETLRQKFPTFASKVLTGTPWLVLSAEVRKEPGALKDIQAAENLTRAVGRLATDIELVRRACEQIAGSGVASKAQLDSVVEKMQSEAPHLREEVHGYVAFATKMTAQAASAGAAPISVHIAHLTYEVERFLRRGRRLKGALWAAVGEKISVRHPRLKIAVIWAAYSCHSSISYTTNHTSL